MGAMGSTWGKKLLRIAFMGGVLALGCVPGFAQVSFFNNSASAINGFTRIQYDLSNKINPSSSGSLTSIRVRIGDFSGNTSGENFQLRVCPDNNGQPSANNCSNFSNSQYFPNGTETNFPGAYSYGWFTFTGTFSVTANQPFWVTMSSNTTGLYSQYTSGGGGAYIGTGYQSPYNVLTQQSFTWLMELTGTAAPVGTPISNTALLILAGLLASGGIWVVRNRQFV